MDEKIPYLPLYKTHLCVPKLHVKSRGASYSGYETRKSVQKLGCLVLGCDLYTGEYGARLSETREGVVRTCVVGAGSAGGRSWGLFVKSLVSVSAGQGWCFGQKVGEWEGGTYGISDLNLRNDAAQTRSSAQGNCSAKSLVPYSNRCKSQSC